MATRLNVNRKRSILLLAASLMLLLVAACSSSDSAAPEPTPELEPARTSIRTGLYLRDSELGDANFSAILPEGWAAADEPAYPVNGRSIFPSGAIARVGHQSVTIRYSIELPGGIDLQPFPDVTPEAIEIDGVPVDLMVPLQPDVIHDRMRIHASFPWLPGDPDRSFGLSVMASGIRGQEMLDQTRSIIESIRFAPPPEAPAPIPPPEVTPGPDWVRVYSHNSDRPDERIFSVLAPPDWKFEPAYGLDSFIGSFTNDQVSIFFDFGSASAAPTGYPYHLIDPDSFPVHTYWIEVIENKPFVMYRPADDPLRERAYTGISVSRIPGLPDLVMPEGSYSSTIYGCGGSFWATSVNHETQELVLAILRTLQAERDSPRCR